jgi:predicted PurR-regulated permease PerM
VRPANAPPPNAAPFLIAGIVVVALYFGRELFVPLALAILLSFIIAPLALVLRRWGAGRVVSVLLAILVAVTVLAALGTMVTRQVTRMASELPRYEYTIRDKVQRLQAAFTRTGVVESASSVIKGVSKELEKPPEDEKAARERTLAPQEEEKPKPMPVEVHQPPPTAVENLRNIAGPLLKPVAIAGIVLVFVIFILLQREDLRDRIIRLFGTRDLQRTTAALDDAAYRLSRYFLTQLLLNAAFGCVIGVGLFFIGVPNAILWGIVAALMRFVPYIGGFIAAGGPALLAIAVDPGWSMAVWTLALFAISEPFMGQVVEPWVYGHRTGVSSLAIIVAATFWTLLWGPVGLLLSTPLTLCLVVLGRHVDQLQFLDVLLGDKPALAPEQTFYQRLLAADPIEIVDQAEACLEAKSLLAYYDDVAIRGLALAQTDLRNGLLATESQGRILSTISEVIEDLADRPDELPQKAQSASTLGKPGTASQDDVQSPLPPVLEQKDLRSDWTGDTAVLCVAGTNALDEAAAGIFAQLLKKHGIGARVAPSNEGPPGTIAEMANVRLVCLSFLDPNATNAARFQIRRLRRQIAGPAIMVGLWGQLGSAAGDQLAKSTGADSAVTSLRQGLEEVIAMAARDRVPRAAE